MTPISNNPTHILQSPVKKLTALGRGFHWQNFSWQTVNYAIGGVLMILFWVYLANMWSQTLFGQFSTIFVWAAIYSLVTDLGLDFWVTRQTSLDKNSAYPAQLVKFKLYSSALIALVFILLAYIVGLPLSSFVVLLTGTFILNISHFFSCYLRGCEKLAVEAKMSVVRHVLFIAVGGLGVAFGQQLLWVVASYALSCAVMAIMTAVVLKRLSFGLYGESFKLKSALKTSFNVWVTTLLIGLSIKLDVLLLGFLADQQQVALYSAPVRIFEGGLLLATAFVLTLFPALTKTHNQQPEGYVAAVLSYSKLLLLIMVPAAIVGIVVGNQLFVLLYGEAYRASVSLFIYLMVVLPLSALVNFLYHALVIAGKAKPVILLLLGSVLINLIFDLWLIPEMKTQGVLVSFYFKEVALFCGLVWLLYRLKGQSV